jgi:hypothetical protein
MPEWKDMPVTNEQFNKVMEGHAQAIANGVAGIIRALERNTKAQLAHAMIVGQIATGAITHNTTVQQLEKLINEHLDRSYQKP